MQIGGSVLTPLCSDDSIEFSAVFQFKDRKTRCPTLGSVSDQLALVVWKVFMQTFDKTQKVQSLLSESPFSDGKVTLLAEATFLQINTLAHPAWSTPSAWDN